MKVALLCLSVLAVGLASCSTITLENRRDMYCGYGHVNGPYTRMLKEGVTVKKVEITASDYKDVVK